MTMVAITYEQLADRLGITVHSARRMVNRHRWRKTLDNDGRTLVHAPEVYLAQREAERRAPEAASETASEAARETALGAAPQAAPLADLMARLATLQAELAEMAHRAGAAEARVGDLDRELTEALRIITELRGKAFERDRLLGQLEGLQALLEDVKSERERWHVHAERLAEHWVRPGLLEWLAQRRIQPAQIIAGSPGDEPTRLQPKKLTSREGCNSSVSRSAPGMRFLVLLIALFGGFVLVAILVAPQQPTLRAWYLQNACPLLDQLSPDICASARREAGRTV